MGFLREFAFILYQLPSGWKKDADRRHALSGIMTVGLIFNLIAARVFAQFLINSGDLPRSLMPSKPVWLLIMGAVFFVFYRLVLTPEAYDSIKWRSKSDPLGRARARSYGWIYVVLTIAAYIGALVLVTPR